MRDIAKVSNLRHAKVSSARFNSLILARGIAAMLVVAHHAGSMAAQPRFFGEHAFDGILTRFTGVGFFFVLSGFFIGWINWKQIGCEREAWEFCKKRLVRIYPAYWCVLIPLIGLYTAFPNAGIPSQRDPTNTIFSFLLLPYPLPPVFGAAWTLVHEVFFCAIFTMIIWCGRKAIWILPAWAITICIMQSTSDQLAFPQSFLLSASNLQFLMGVGVARLFQKWRPPVPIALTLIGVFLYFGFMLTGALITKYYFIERFIYGVGSGLIILGLVGIEHKYVIFIPKLFVLLGSAAFGIYLIHPIALSFGAHLLIRLPPGLMSVETVVLILIFIGSLTGTIFYLFIEMKIVAVVNGWRVRDQALS